MSSHSVTRRTARKFGFTLIELLVVIAIIAILAAILFPVFARARENARRASCQSNLKQISLGIFQYTQDYDEKYPPSNQGISWDAPADWPSGTAGDGTPAGTFLVVDGSATPAAHYAKTWMDSIFPYVKSTQILVCPSRGGDKNVPSYGYNAAINGSLTNEAGIDSGKASDTTTRVTGIAMAAVQRPSETVMLNDINEGQWSLRSCPLLTGLAQDGPGYWRTATMPHLDGGVIAFADGHVKSFSRGNTIYSNPPGSTAGVGYLNRSWNPFLP